MKTRTNKNQIKLQGGSTGQALVKLSNADFDYDWGNVAGGGSGNIAEEFDDFINWVDTDDSSDNPISTSGNFYQGAAPGNIFSTETDHQGIVTITTTGGNAADILGFIAGGQLSAGGVGNKGLIPKGNDFRFTYVGRSTRPGASFDTIIGLTDDTGNYDLYVRFSSIISATKISYWNGGQTVSAINLPISGNWFTLVFDYVASTGVITVSIDGIQIFSAVAVFANNQVGFRFGSVGGTAGTQLSTDYVRTLYRNISSSNGAVKFGGTGSDGALAISSGTTTIDLTGLPVFELNYTSIAITGTADLKFINPHSNGTVVIIKSQGDVTLTSSATPMIDCSGLGAAGGSGGVRIPQVGNTTGSPGSNGVTENLIVDAGNGGGTANPTPGGIKPSAYQFSVNYSVYQIYKQRYPNMTVGSGGGGGQAIKGLNNTDTAIGGNGGPGGGCLIIECAGAWNFTTANGISVAGQNGADGSSVGLTDVAGAGGGGGGSGNFLCLYNILTSNTGTINISGGVGGLTLETYVANPIGGGGGASGINNGNNGVPAANGIKSGGDGAIGDAIVLFNSEYA